MAIENDEQEILALHEAGDKALMSADLSVDCFDRARDSRIRRHGACARVGIRRSRSQRKTVCRAIRLPRRATQTQWRVEIGGVAVGAADGRIVFPSVPLCSLW